MLLFAAATVVTLASCSGESDKHRSSRTSGGSEAEETGRIRVKTIRPRKDPELEVTVEEPAYVEAYYRANLEARVAGPVKFIEKAVGSDVSNKERLIEIDVPDMVQELAQKRAVVEQRNTELALAEANMRIANAALRAADKSEKVAEIQVTAATEEEDFRGLEFNRYKKLASGPSPAVTADVVDERLKWYNVTKANRLAAEANVLKAKAELEGMEEKVHAALADIELKKNLIKVAQADCDVAQSRLDLATIRAPFEGRIVERGVDPGAFVHSAATTEKGKPLLTIERTDIVTIHMNVPDTYAAYVGKDNKAIIEMKELPGQRFEAQVTRYVPSLQTPEHDRTMRVEVDLYNGTEQEYRDFITRQWLNGFEGLKGKILPQLPKVDVAQGATRAGNLIPGMYGKMKLKIRRFENVYMLPSQAIVREGGTAYVYIVNKGVVQRVEADVDLDDGNLATVRLVKDGRKTPLTGSEEIVASNQGELRDAQQVEATHVEWK
jgi:multidrug efflux pump subunit AcrA (membrane-fusion protein)